ncbi:MAG: hypothetical protein ACR2PA_11475 [Hyphomicrobiaceae bacterium]
MPKLAVHIENGQIQRIETDDQHFDSVEIAVIVDNEPKRLLRPIVESAVADYVESVRGAELCYSLSSTCFAIGNAFKTVGSRGDGDAEALLADIESTIINAREAIEVAKRQAGWHANNRQPALRALVAK